MENCNMSIAEKSACIKQALKRKCPGVPFAFLHWNLGRPRSDFQVSILASRGTYSKMVVIVMGDLRAPTDDENQYFARMQKAHYCVAVCYCVERALEAINSYLRLQPGQRFGEGIPVFKGGPG